MAAPEHDAVGCEERTPHPRSCFHGPRMPRRVEAIQGGADKLTRPPKPPERRLRGSGGSSYHGGSLERNVNIVRRGPVIVIAWLDGAFIDLKAYQVAIPIEEAPAHTVSFQLFNGRNDPLVGQLIP